MLQIVFQETKFNNCFKETTARVGHVASDKPQGTLFKGERGSNI